MLSSFYMFLPISIYCNQILAISIYVYLSLSKSYVCTYLFLSISLCIYLSIYLVYLHSSCPIECHLTESNLISCKSNPISFSRSSIPGLAEDDFRNGKSTTWGNTIVFLGGFLKQIGIEASSLSEQSSLSVVNEINLSVNPSINQSNLS